MGPSLLPFGLDTGVGGYLPEKKENSKYSSLRKNLIQKGPIGISFFPASKPPTPSGEVDFWSGFGRYWGGVKIGTVFLKKLGSDLVVQSSR